MKESSGELSMTVIVIIGAIAIVGLLTWLTPMIKTYIEGQWGEITGSQSGTGAGTPIQNP